MSSLVREPVDFDAPLLIDCDKEYGATFELLKYVAQCAYLLPGLVLHLALLRVIMFNNRKEYFQNSYYVIFSIDCVVNILFMFFTICVDRLLMYVVPLCEPLALFFSTPSVLQSFIIVQSNYLRIAKLTIQIFATVNRMTCVLSPLGYSFIWRKLLKLVIVVILISPFSVIWNLLISRTYPIPIFGGFSFGYKRRVAWASLSLLSLCYQSIALLITSICTVITLYYLLKLPERIKSAEKSLCSASICISICFLVNSAFHIYFAFFRGDNFKTFYALEFVAFDISILCTPLLLLAHSRQLRQQVFQTSSRTHPIMSVSSQNNASVI